jgi:hypothetical protein
MRPIQIPTRDLRLADTVIVTNDCGPWNTSIVRKVTDTEVMLFRPYGTTADFSYTGGVICYVGIEEFSIPRGDHPVTILDRKELR